MQGMLNQEDQLEQAQCRLFWEGGRIRDEG